MAWEDGDIREYVPVCVRRENRRPDMAGDWQVRKQRKNGGNDPWQRE